MDRRVVQQRPGQQHRRREEHAAPGDEGAPGPPRPRGEEVVSPRRARRRARRAPQGEAAVPGSSRTPSPPSPPPRRPPRGAAAASRRKACARADGSLALTPHPAALGSALTHPNITTDFSESQLELITGVHADADGCLEELTEIHQFVVRAIGDELLWVSSMPCTPAGRRERSRSAATARPTWAAPRPCTAWALAHRYGRRMQTISGIHYNWSLPGSAATATSR